MGMRIRIFTDKLLKKRSSVRSVKIENPCSPYYSISFPKYTLLIKFLEELEKIIENHKKVLVTLCINLEGNQSSCAFYESQKRELKYLKIVLWKIRSSGIKINQLNRELWLMFNEISYIISNLYKRAILWTQSLNMTKNLSNYK